LREPECKAGDSGKECGGGEEGEVPDRVCDPGRDDASGNAAQIHDGEDVDVEVA
jgi:hypothetical protein